MKKNAVLIMMRKALSTVLLFSGLIAVFGNSAHAVVRAQVTNTNVVKLTWDSTGEKKYSNSPAYKIVEQSYGDTYKTRTIYVYNTSKNYYVSFQQTGHTQYKLYYARKNGSGYTFIYEGTAYINLTHETSTIYEYDALGRLIKVNDPKNGNRRYELDDAGNRERITK